jgi:drug/metabolite transporter (DMT)-like permease
MSVFAGLLLVTSAFLHAGWNLLGKTVHPSPAFFLIATLFSCLLLTPAILINGEDLLLLPPLIWQLLFLTGFFQAVYMWALAGAYKHGAISIAYPLLRTLPVLLIAIMTALLAQGESLGLLATSGIVLVSLGCLIIPIPSLRKVSVRTFINMSCCFALVSAFGTVGYTLVDDKVLALLRNNEFLQLSVIEISLIYLFFVNLSASVWLCCIVLPNRSSREHVREIVHKHLSKTALTGFAMTLTYALVLVSMAYVDNVSYVVAFRQLSIPIAVIFTIYLLKEPGTPSKLIGTLTLFTGIVLISLA